MSGEEPTFADFVEKRRFKKETIDLLVAEGYDDLELLAHLTPERIAELVVVGLRTGEALRLELSVKFLRKAAGLDVTIDEDSSSKHENGNPKGENGGNGDGRSEKQDGGDGPEKVTTKTLAQNKEVNAIVDELLSDQGKLQGLKQLLSLVEIRQGVHSGSQGGGSQGGGSQGGVHSGSQGGSHSSHSDSQNIPHSTSTPKSQGEQISSPTERPLLIGDFITSCFRYSVRDEEESIELNDSSRIVVRKSNKPRVEDYDIEIWTSANSRIIQYLLRSKVSQLLLQQYLEYSSIISEYFCIYQHEGIFSLDYEHRHRVAREGRAWNDICVIDEKKFLVYDHHKDSKSKSKESKKSKKSRRRNTKNQLDGDDNIICQNFNARSGCDYDACRYSHVCLYCWAKHPKFECPKSSKTHAK